MRFAEDQSNCLVGARTTGSLKVREHLYPPALVQPRHLHPFASFSFVSSGAYSETFGRKTFGREPRTVIFHPPDESHAVVYESRVRILSVHFSFEKLARIREQSTILDSPSSCQSETVNWLGTRLRQELRQRDTASALAIEGLALEMLAAASRNKMGREHNFPQWLKDARDFIHENFADSFALEDVAKIAGVHQAHLSRVFRQKFGCTVGDYVRRLRVESACRQIVHTDVSLSVIASNAGFSDQSHFNKVFKSLLNLTPYEYRKMSRAG